MREKGKKGTLMLVVPQWVYHCRAWKGPHLNQFRQNSVSTRSLWGIWSSWLNPSVFVTLPTSPLFDSQSCVGSDLSCNEGWALRSWPPRNPLLHLSIIDLIYVSVGQRNGFFFSHVQVFPSVAALSSSSFTSSSTVSTETAQQAACPALTPVSL